MMSQMVPRLLSYQVAIAESENLHRAAKRLDVSPSALSRTLQSLERDVGAPLFERRGRARRPRGGVARPRDQRRVLRARPSALRQKKRLGRRRPPPPVRSARAAAGTRALDGWPSELRRRVALFASLLDPAVVACEEGDLLAVFPDDLVRRLLKGSTLVRVPIAIVPPTPIYGVRKPSRGRSRSRAAAFLDEVRGELGGPS